MRKRPYVLKTKWLRWYNHLYTFIIFFMPKIRDLERYDQYNRTYKSYKKGEKNPKHKVIEIYSI